jgi:hypothetical protein
MNGFRKIGTLKFKQQLQQCTTNHLPPGALVLDTFTWSCSLRRTADYGRPLAYACVRVRVCVCVLGRELRFVGFQVLLAATLAAVLLVVRERIDA